MATHHHSGCLQLTTVEALLTEFHDSRTGNDRKRSIDQQLVRHQSHPDAWAESLHNLRNFHSDQYLWFFNATTVQLAISVHWTTSLRREQCQQIREAVWQNYTSQQHSTKMQRDKMAQLIGLMGKRDFPADHPDFMQHVQQVLAANFDLGITLVRAISEELCSTKDDVSSERKAEFHASLAGCVADCMDVLCRFLAVFSTHVNCVDRGLPRQTMPYQELAQVIPAGDDKIFASAVDCLTCIQHLLTWISLDNHLTHNLVEQLFDLALYREGPLLGPISVAGLTTITELFYRQVALPQIRAIANGLKNIIQQPMIKKCNEMYQDKLAELLRLFATQHWREWTQDDDLPNILSALYEFTFSGYGALTFTERLAIWCPMVSGLSTSGGVRYIEIVQLLVSGILRKMQFRFDQESELDILDNERLDDDNETEWQQYLRQCIETICLIAEDRPFQVFEQVYSDWQRPFEMFMSLEKSHDGQAITITDYTRCHLIHCVTRDLASLCQTLTSLIPTLNDRPENLPQNVHNLTTNLVSAVAFMANTRLHRLNVTMPQLTIDFVDIFSQILSALRSFVSWSPTLHLEATLKPLIEHAAGVLVPQPLTASHSGAEPKMITLAAAQLLVTITSTLRPKYALESPSLQQLVQAGQRLHHLDPMAVRFVHQCVVQCFVLPWWLGLSASASAATTGPGSGEQDMERRAMLLQEYVAGLAYDLLQLDETLASGQQDKIVKIVSSVLPVLTDCLDHFKEHGSAVKHMLFAAYKPSIAKSISLFNSFGTANAAIADAVLNFSLTVVRTLQMQLGAVHIKEMLSIFLEASMRERMTVGRLKAMDKLLQMLLLVVEQPGSTTLSLLPAILTVSLDLVQPLLSGQSADLGDVAVSLFSLFDGILHHRWQYFYKSQVLRGFSPAERIGSGGADHSVPSDAETPPQHPEQLLAILTAYGHAMVGAAANDPHVMRLLLRSLHSLNERYRLFGRRFFRDQLLSSFHCALINALASATGALHTDQLLGVLFTMGQVSVAQFHASFVALGYAADSPDVEAVCLAADLPTFSQLMADLMQDTRCLRFTAAH